MHYYFPSRLSQINCIHGRCLVYGRHGVDRPILEIDRTLAQRRQEQIAFLLVLKYFSFSVIKYEVGMKLTTVLSKQPFHFLTSDEKAVGSILL